MTDVAQIETAEQTEQQGASLRANLPFRSYWAGYAVSQFGDRITELALPLTAVLVLHASTSEVAFLTAAVWVPYLCALVVGAWVERRPSKRSVQVAADLGRALLLLSLPVAWWLDVLSLPQLFVIAAMTGLAEVFFNTAASNVFANLVPQSAFAEANSKLSAVRSTAFLAGPALGGVLIQALTAPIAVVVDAFSFVVSAFCIGRIKHPEAAVPPASEQHSLLRSAREGLAFVLRHKYLRSSLTCVTTLNFFSFIGIALTIVFASRYLHLSAGVIGLAFGIGSCGALVAALIAPRVGRFIGVGRTIVVGALMFASSYLIIAVAGGGEIGKAAFLAAAEFVGGAGIMLFDVNLNAVQASVTPDDMRSRAAGAFSTINYGIRPIGAIVGGILGSTIGVREALIVAAVGSALSICWLVASPIRAVREMGDLVAVDPWTGLPGVAEKAAGAATGV